MEKNTCKSDYWDNRLSWATATYFIGSVGNATIKTILPIPDSLWGVISAIVGVAIILIFAINYKEMIRRSSKVFKVSVVLFLFIYLLSAILITLRGEPLGQMVIGTALLTFAWWIPVGVYGSSVSDKSILYSVWVKASYVISFCCIMLYFFHIPPEEDNGSIEYNMTFGFQLILPLLIQINHFLKEKKLWLLILILFELFAIFVYASRGILLSLIFYFVYKFAFESNSRIRKVVSIFILIITTIAMLSSIQSIASYIVGFLDVFGYESRTIEMLASGVVSDTSGRDNIWKLCFKMIEERPILGWGLGGEYCRLGFLEAGARPEDVTAVDCNPHNGIVQNFVCFGVFGGLLSTLLILLPIFHLGKIKDKSVHDLTLIFLSASVIPICISSAGFFVTPAVAMYLYLFYFGRRKSIISPIKQ